MGEVLTPMKLADVLAGLTINTGGGAYVEGDASIGGDFSKAIAIVHNAVFDIVALSIGGIIGKRCQDTSDRHDEERAIPAVEAHEEIAQ